MREIKNAKIESTSLGFEDHGVLSCWLTFDYGGMMQGFGGYCLDTPIKDAKGIFLRRQGTAWGTEFIGRILKTLGVASWEKLPGTHLRVDAEWGKVYRIGHILEDKWFDPAVDLEPLLKGH